MCRKALEDDPRRSKARWSLALLLQSRHRASGSRESQDKAEAREHILHIANDANAPNDLRLRAFLAAVID